MKKRLAARILSLLLAVTTVVSLLPGMTTTASAADEYATPATTAELGVVPNWFVANNGAGSNGAYAKLINGSVYMWGQNERESMGFQYYVAEDGNLREVTYDCIVPNPTMIPREGFNNENIVQISAGTSGWAAVSESGNVYTWGYTPSGTRVGDTRIFKVDTSEITNAGHKAVYVYTCGAVTAAKDEAGNWYTVLGGAYFSSGVFSRNDQWNYPWAALQGTEANAISEHPNWTNDRHLKFYPISNTVKQSIGNRQIQDIGFSWFWGTLVLTTDGKVWGTCTRNAGANSYGTGMSSIPSGKDGRNQLFCYQDEVALWRNLKFTSIFCEDQTAMLVDSNGDVWGWGPNHQNRFGTSPSNTLDATHKIFDHERFQKTAVKCWASFHRVVVLADDNTVYAMGNNSNGAISADISGNISTMTQCFKELSQKYTIVGVFPANTSQIVVTKSGDLFFAGDNTFGGAGNGTTTKIPAGTTHKVTNSALPPSAAVTTNRIFFELEVTESDGTVACYRPVDGTNISSNSKYTKYVAGAVVQQNAELTIEAGKTFKLNVYFEDFGKIHGFTMPLRFDPTQLQVTNSAGVAYSTAQDVVTPGAVGGSTGIEQCFDNSTWPGGTLGDGTTNGTYPKISNAGGWVSVMGYSTEKDNPSIEGVQKMFSITFAAQNTFSGNKVLIEFADSQNASSNATGNVLWDESCVELNASSCTAYWTVYNAAGEGEIGDAADGYFAFEHQPFPAFNTKLNRLSKLEQTLSYSTTTIPETLTGSTQYGSTANPGWEVNWGNSSITYTINSIDYHKESNGQHVRGASFPQVTWTYNLLDNNTVIDADAQDSRGRTLSDYISVLQTGSTALRFRINPSFTPEDKEGPVYIKVTNTSAIYTGVSSTYYICLHTYEAPSTLNLAQKQNEADLTPTAIASGTVLTYHTLNSESLQKTFYVDFDGATENLDVVWTLYDSDGNEISNTDPDAKVSLDVLTSDVKNPYAKVKVHGSTGDDYVMLRVQSLYDSNRYAEVKIVVQLYAEKLQFSPEIIRIPTSTAESTSTVDLSRYLQKQPLDVYSTSLTWEVISKPTGEPANKDESFVSGTQVTWGSLGSGATASVFTAFEYATPLDPEEFVTVRVTDALSGKKAEVKIAIVALDCPITMDNFVATNAIGTRNDTVKILDGLRPGDVVRFYTSYEEAMQDKASGYENPNRKTTISAPEMYPSFTFSVGSKDESLMKGEGGYLAIVITRSDGLETPVTYMPIPVLYDPEPSEVYGYAHLFGKTKGSSADADIRIDLTGLNFRETVYTDNQGYFKFTKYIAPGTYTMVLSKTNYLTRRIEPDYTGVGGLVITVGDGGKFCIATQKDPIELVPGELNGDNRIDISDITTYVSNWVGLSDDTINNFTLYDFIEDGAISMRDLQQLLKRRDWMTSSYPTWNVPNQ